MKAGIPNLGDHCRVLRRRSHSTIIRAGASMPLLSARAPVSAVDRHNKSLCRSVNGPAILTRLAALLLKFFLEPCCRGNLRYREGEHR